MSASLHVVAVGARTPLGHNAACSAAAVRCRLSAASEHPTWLDRKGQPIYGAAYPMLAPEAPLPERLEYLASHALVDVGASLGEAADSLFPALFVTLAEPRPHWTSGDQDKFVAALDGRSFAGLRPQRPRRWGHGHAGALQVIESVFHSALAGQRGCCLVLGVDSYFQVETMRDLIDHNLPVTEGARAGFFVGEGGGCLLLADATTVAELRLPSVARIVGIATALETSRFAEGEENLGLGLSSAIAGACVDLQSPIDDVYCDINGTRERTGEWGFAMLRKSELFRDPTAAVTPAESWGDMGAASAPLLTMLAIRAWARNHASGPRALVFAGSRSGLRGAMLLEGPLGS